MLALADSEARHTGLRKALGPIQITTLGIGAIIGAGIFVLTGQAAANYAGPAIVYSFIIAALISLFAALCYAEMASLVPVSGSAYTYAYVCMGEFPAWLIGWVLIMEYLLTLATVAVGWSGYFTSFLEDCGIKISTALSNAPLAYDSVHGWAKTGAYINIPALCVVGVIGVFVALGIRVAASINSIMVVIKMLVILLFIVFGIAFINMDNWVPFIPPNTGNFGEFGWSGILRGAGVVFFAYNGFDAISTLAQEARNPKKDLPLGMLGSLGISTIVYILMALLLTGLVSYTMLNVSDPIGVAINVLGPKWMWLRFFVKLGILSGLASVILVMLLGTTRVLYTISHDGLLPKSFGKIHSRFRTPAFGTLVVTLIAMIMAALFPVGMLGLLVSIGALLVFGFVCVGILILRYTKPSLKRPFKCPMFPLIPFLGGAACLMQMFLLPMETWRQLLAWMILGCAVYFFYGRKHSKLQR